MKKYQYGDKIDLSNLFGSNPLFSGFLKNANNFSDQFSSQLAPSVATGVLGEKPEQSSFKEFAQSKGFNPLNPLNIFKKGFLKLPKQYKEYAAQTKEDITKYDQGFNSVSQNIPALLGSLSMLMQGMKGQQQYDMSQANQPDLTETPSYQQGGSIDEMIEQDPWLNARGNIESSMNQDTVSGAGAVGMFQITPIALKEYNRKYDSKYTWDHVKTNAVANAHVSQGLIKDIRSMIDKVDNELSDFDKNILAEMAYNYGPYRFLDKLKAKGKNVTLQDMLNEKSLPTETRNHGKKFIDHFEKNRPLAEEKVLAPRDNTYVSKVDKLGTLAKFKGDPFEYKREGDDYFYRKGSGEFKPINEAGKRELQRRKFQYGGYISSKKIDAIKDSLTNLFLDKKYVVSKDSDSTLLPKDIKRVYSKDGNQIGYTNKEGMFLPIGSKLRFDEGFISKNTPVAPPIALLQKQLGGNINTTGYSANSLTNNNTYNIIPGGHITAKPMDNNTLLQVSPIYKNGIGNSFLYKKGMQDVIDKNAIGFIEKKYPFYKFGGIIEGEFELDDIDTRHIEYLKKLGYKVDIL